MANKWERFTTKAGFIGTLLALIPVLKFIWNFIATIADVQFLAQSSSWLWGQMDKPIVQLPTFFSGVALVVWALLRKEPEESTKPTNTVPEGKNDLRGNVEFYLNRDAKHERFDALMKNATNVWVAAHQATTLRGNRAWWDKIERLILLEQGGFANDLLARVTQETTVATINNDIASAIADAGRRLEVKSLDAFFNSMIIGNPNSGDSWVFIEIYIPWCPARHRPSILITEREHAAAVKGITLWFDAMWMQQPQPNQRALHDERELKLLRTHLDAARSEAASLKLEKLTKELVAQKKGAQLSVLVQFINWEKSHRVADEIEAVFQMLDWHVTPHHADGSRLRNPSHSLVVIESKIRNLASTVASLFNEGKLISQNAVANDGNPLSDNLDETDITVTVFPSAE
jgi:hypothetical protein